MQDAAASGPHFGGKHTLREALLLRWKSGCWFELRHGIALRGKVICEWCVEWVGRGGGGAAHKRIPSFRMNYL